MPYSEEHFEKTVEWLNDKELRKKFGLTYQVTMESHRHFLATNSNIEFLALYDNGEYVGNIVLNNQPRHFSTYLQIYLSPESPKGLGLGTSFMKLGIEYLFQKKKFHRIWLHVREDNVAAKRLYEKLGFRKEGVERDSVFDESKFISQTRMSLLASEFKPGVI